MQIQRFEIKSFKGIKEARIELSIDVPGNIITLIGLNESGKTTLLEALSKFVTADENASSLVSTVHQKNEIHDYIPKGQKAALMERFRLLRKSNSRLRM